MGFQKGNKHGWPHLRAARADANQPDIVSALRKAGCKVEHTHTVGGGFPDTVVWAKNPKHPQGRTFLVEIKVPGKGLTKQQVEFIAEWPGEMYVVSTEEEALQAAVGPY